jgi:hypothetical protein
MERAEFILCDLQGQSSAELRLPARTLEEDDQVAGDGKRHGTPEVLFPRAPAPDRSRPLPRPRSTPDRRTRKSDRARRARWENAGQVWRSISNGSPHGARPARPQRRAGTRRCRQKRRDEPAWPAAVPSRPAPDFRPPPRPLAPGDKQGIQRLARLRERTCRKRYAGRGRSACAALRHDPEQIGPLTSRVSDKIVGGGEHLNGPRDTEQLHRRIGEHVDHPDRVSRGARGFWHFHQSMRG